MRSSLNLFLHHSLHHQHGHKLGQDSRKQTLNMTLQIIIFVSIAPFIQEVQFKVLHIDISQTIDITQHTDTSKRHKNKQKIANI